MEPLANLQRDLTLALRSLATHKSWSAIVVLTLAIGIGANSALFTVVNAVLLRRLPYSNADRVVSLSEADESGDWGQVTDATYLRWAGASRAFQAVGAFEDARVVVSSTDEQTPEFTDGRYVTPTYFAVLGVRPALGRTFTGEEALQGSAPVVMLSEQIWRRRFGSDSTLLGSYVMIDGQATRVLGVMPSSFTTEHGALVWLPMRLPPVPDQFSTLYFSMIGRLRDGVTVARARDELTALDRQDRRPGSSDARTVPVVMTLHERLYGDARPPLMLLFGAVGVLLLIACANIVSLLLVRAIRRRREFAIRLAIGASRWRVMRYLLGESLVLSLAAGVLGLLVPLLTVRGLARMAPSSIASVEGISIDGRVVMFTVSVAVLTGLLVGLLPAWEVGRGSLSALLSNGGARVANTRQRTVRQALIVVELATAVVLLTCAGLLARSFVHVLAIDPGFRPAHLLDVAIELQPTEQRTTPPAVLFATVLEHSRNLPGVEAAALADVLPLGGASRSYAFQFRGKQSPIIDLSVVTPGYFSAIGAQIVTGRALDAGDRRGAPLVAVVNQSLARALYGDAGRVGERLKVPGDSGRGATIIGVVKDMPRRELEAGAHPTAYVSLEQVSASSDEMHLVLRTRGNPTSVFGSVRRLIREADPSIPAPRLTTMEHVMSMALAPRRFSFVLLGTFAALGAILAAVGLYGVIASLVADRTREIGIRIALGADVGQVIRFVVAQGTRLLIVGLALGLVASIWAVRLLRTMIFEVQMYDAGTFLAAAATLGIVALGASYVPAARATSIDPLLALRDEG